MSDIIIHPKPLSGTVTPPPFKSEVIRSLILSSLCGKHPCEVIANSDELCDDILNAKKAVELAFFTDTISEIPVGESATLLRLLAPILIAKRGHAVFKAEHSLMLRDMEPRADGADIEFYKKEDLICFKGRIPLNGRITVDASRSSQFASGFLVCLSFVKGLKVKLLSPVSVPYIELTIAQLEKYGCNISVDENGFYYLENGALHQPENILFSGDMSYCANFFAANFIMSGNTSKPIQFAPNRVDMKQGDARILELIHLNEFSLRDTPDLFPILAVAALKKSSDTVILGTKRLADKESNRVLAVKNMIEALGGHISVFDDAVTIHGSGGILNGGTVFSMNDHRIVMAASVAALMCRNSVTIRSWQAIRKSAPQFFKDYVKLGGTISEHIRQQD